MAAAATTTTATAASSTPVTLASIANACDDRHLRAILMDITRVAAARKIYVSPIETVEDVTAFILSKKCELSDLFTIQHEIQRVMLEHAIKDPFTVTEALVAAATTTNAIKAAALAALDAAVVRDDDDDAAAAAAVASTVSATTTDSGVTVIDTVTTITPTPSAAAAAATTTAPSPMKHA